MSIIKNNIILKNCFLCKAFIFKNKEICIKKNKIDIKNIDNEINYFSKIYKKTINQFNKIKSFLPKEIKKIFCKRYKIILKNNKLKKNIINFIKNKKIYSDFSIKYIINKYINNIKKKNNIFLKERINIFLDIQKRLLYNLYKIKFINFNFLKYIKDKIIIISNNIFFSQIVKFNFNKIIGFITELNNKNSINYLFIKYLNLINIINIKNITKIISNNDSILIDINKNNIYVNSIYNKII